MSDARNLAKVRTKLRKVGPGWRSQAVKCKIIPRSGQFEKTNPICRNNLSFSMLCCYMSFPRKRESRSARRMRVFSPSYRAPYAAHSGERKGAKADLKKRTQFTSAGCAECHAGNLAKVRTNLRKVGSGWRSQAVTCKVIPRSGQFEKTNPIYRNTLQLSLL